MKGALRAASAVDLHYESKEDIPPGPLRRDSRFLFRRLAETVTEATTAGQRGRVLDVGCGYGDQLLRLCARGWEVWGLDASGALLHYCRRKLATRGASGVLVHGIAERLPFRDQSFDRVVCRGSLDHFARPGAFLAETARGTIPDERFANWLKQDYIFVREAIKGVPRDKLLIQSKTRALHPEVAKVDLNRFRQELGVDYLDCLLMHCMTTAGWTADMRPVMDVLFEAKEKEIVRSVGISCHGFEALGSSVESDWLDVQLVRINPFGRSMDAEPEKVVPRVKAMHEQGKGVIGMKIFACDRNMTPDERFESLKFVLGLGCVDCFTIGFESTDEIDQAMDMIEKVLS